MVCKYYGLGNKAVSGTSERDQNFFVTAADGRRLVLKISNSCEEPAALASQNEVLLHLADSALQLGVPSLVPTRTGKMVAKAAGRSGMHLIRLLTCLAGSTISPPVSAALRHEIGSAAARLDMALSDMRYENGRVSDWDMRRAGKMRGQLGRINNAGHRSMITAAIDRFETEALPRFGLLRNQLIHHDLHASNLLVDAIHPDRLCGIIDFGDMAVAPLVLEPAIAAVHQAILSAQPLKAALDVIAAYHAILPLTRTEFTLLPAIMLGRLAMRMTIIARHNETSPGDGHFRAGSDEACWKAMQILLACAGGDIEARVLAAGGPQRD